MATHSCEHICLCVCVSGDQILYLLDSRPSSSEKAMALTPVLLPGKSHGQRSLVGCSPWGH